jgi:DNA-directed RNA polymerase subunit RPC12/RpoP
MKRTCDSCGKKVELDDYIMRLRPLADALDLTLNTTGRTFRFWFFGWRPNYEKAITGRPMDIMTWREAIAWLTVKAYRGELMPWEKLEISHRYRCPKCNAPECSH